MKYKCPVCLTDSLDEPYKHCNYDICVMCGVEFGYDDYVVHGGKDFETLQANKHTELREAWIAAGSPNWWEETQQEGFEGGVGWLRQYYADEGRKNKWEEDLASQLKGMKRVK